MRRLWSRPIPLLLAWLLALGLGLAAPVAAVADDAAEPTAPATTQPAAAEEPTPKPEQPAKEEAKPDQKQPEEKPEPTPSPDPTEPAATTTPDAPAPDPTEASTAPDEAPGQDSGSASADPVERSSAARRATSFARSGFVTGTTTTYTHADGETVTYNAEVAPGEPIRISGTGWLAKPDRVDEGEEGSVIGVKLIDPTLGQLSRRFALDNPRLGTPVANLTVWGTVWADSQGDFALELAWPDGSTAVGDPGWEAGDSFTLQLLSGTMYSDQASVDPNLRPDVSRTVALTLAVADGDEPEPPTPAAPEVTVEPRAATVAPGSAVTFTSGASGEPAPTVQWQRSTALNATTAPTAWLNLAGATEPSLTVTAGTSPHVNNRWYRAVWTNEHGTVTTSPVKLSVIAAPTVTSHPRGATISQGQTATFTVASSGEATVRWQATGTSLANGEPNDATWTDVPGADAATLTVSGDDPAAQHGTHYRAVLSNAGGSTASQPAQLRFFELLDTEQGVRVAGESYGVGGVHPFSVTAPNAVVAGLPIVIQGEGYLHTDGRTGSVATFFVDAAYSGDPLTLNTTRTITHPVTGAVIADKRSHAAVQAGSDGTWRVEIPWPDHTNTVKDEAFFAENWAPGSQHTVRILTGSLLDGDNQRGITVRFTVVESPTTPSVSAPVITRQPQDAPAVEAGEPVTFTAAATALPAPSVQWQRSTDGGLTWQDLRGATSPSYTIDAVSPAQDGHRFRAVFRNPAAPDGVATAPARLTVIPRQNVREHCGTSYGPGTANTGIPFCFRGPEKVVFGQPIVIEGVSGYLATDDRTGSVVNFFFDAEFSGDPNTVYSKRLFTNPATGQQISDRRTNAIVQANADGTWRLEIPWPTTGTISPTSDGQGNYTQAELDAKFAPGTTHSFRMLTGSLMNDPADRQRGASLYFTVVESLTDEVGIAEPPYEHQTFASEAAGDRAVAWVQQQVSSGQSIALTGTGWLTRDRQWGSTITVRLQDENGDYYRRPGTADPTVWQVLQAGETGDLDARVPLPEGAGAGDFVAVELTTTDDGTALGDVARHWVSEPLTIDNVPYVPSPAEGATCTAAPGAASYELAPGMATPAANVGGTIRLTGKNWCNLVGGGSLIAIKINDGAYSHRPTATAQLFDANLGQEVGDCPAGACASNKTIWYTIEADDHGSFDVAIPLPTRADSVPAFGEGSYTLRIMTRTLSADPYYQGKRPDPSRTMKSPEFTVVAEGVPLENVKPGRPSAAPDPLHATDDLTDAARRGVTVEQQAKRWVVTIPAAKPGDWVYVNVYDGQSPRFPWNSTWFEVDAKQQVSLPLAGASLPTGSNKLSVQDRRGASLGWTTVTVAAKPVATIRPITTISRMPGAAQLGQARPESTPKQPVAGYVDLTEANTGQLTGTETGGKLTITMPSVDGGHWVYPFLYTETGRVVGTDWVQVGTDHTITVTIGKLPDGIHKLALVDAKGELVGWVTANGPSALPAAPGAPDATGTGEPVTVPAGPTPAEAGPGAAAPAGDGSMTLILLGLAVLVLAGSATGVIALRTPVRPRP